MQKDLREILSEEQKNIYKINYKKAVEYFNLQKGWVLHHKDENLKYTDIDRYIEWRPDDLLPMTKHDHMHLHQAGKKNNFCAYNEAHKEEIRERMREAWRIRKLNPNSYCHVHAGHVHTDEEIEAQRKAMTNRHWYNNGERCVFTYTCPVGFTKGRLKLNTNKN